jgi:transposase-like protein
MSRPKKYPDELVRRGVGLALESGRPIAHIAADLGMHPETLRNKVRQAEADVQVGPPGEVLVSWVSACYGSSTLVAPCGWLMAFRVPRN